MEKHQQRLFLVYSLNAIGKDSVTIRPGKPLYFSNMEKAEDVIQKFEDLFTYLYDDSQEERIYCLVLDEFELDSPHRYQLSTKVYSPKGRLLSDCMVPDDGPFLGRAKNLIHHEIGDLVELPHGDKLLFGIIIGQPMNFNEKAGMYGLTASDDCYTVLHQQSHEVDYAHAPMVFKPTREITEEVKTQLLTAFKQLEVDIQ